jgi:3-isopropylmalate dehydratase small subunit
MQAFTTHTGVVAALDRANVDTDQERAALIEALKRHRPS